MLPSWGDLDQSLKLGVPRSVLLAAAGLTEVGVQQAIQASGRTKVDPTTTTATATATAAHPRRRRTRTRVPPRHYLRNEEVARAERDRAEAATAARDAALAAAAARRPKAFVRTTPVRKSKDGLELVDDLGADAFVPLAMRRAKRERKVLTEESREAPGYADGAKKELEGLQPTLALWDMCEAQREHIMLFRIMDPEGNEILERDPWSFVRTGRQWKAHGNKCPLPRAIRRQLARHAGTDIVPGVNYTAKMKEDLDVAPRLAWRARLEASQCVAQVALRFRELDAALTWTQLRRPFDAVGQPWSSLVIVNKRLCDGGNAIEYLMDVDRRVLDTLASSTGIGSGLLGGGAGSSDLEGSGGGSRLPFLDALREYRHRWFPAGAVPLWMSRPYEERLRRNVTVRALGLDQRHGVLAGGPAAAAFAAQVQPSFLGGGGWERRGSGGGAAGRGRGGYHDHHYDDDDAGPSGGHGGDGSGARGGGTYRTRRRGAIEREFDDVYGAGDYDDDDYGMLGVDGIDYTQFTVPNIEQKPIRGPKGRPRNVDPHTKERVYCLCRSTITDGRPYKVCEACKDCMHPECVGVPWEVLEPLPMYLCPRCEKKVRRAHGLDGGRGRGRPPAGGTSGHDGRRGRGGRGAGGVDQDDDPASTSDEEDEPEEPHVDWSSHPLPASTPEQLTAALGCVEALAALPDAEIFLDPVPEEIPDYYAVIRYPMDVGTVRANLENGNYVSVLEVWRDVESIWSNCLTFNDPTSDLAAAAMACQTAIRTRWVGAGLPLRSSSIGGGGGHGHGTEGTEGTLPPAHRPVAVGANSNWMKHVQDLLETQWEAQVEGLTDLCAHVPREKDAPGYTNYVSVPMTLSWMRRRWKKNRYSRPWQVWNDLRLIWANAIQFAPKGSRLSREAARLQRGCEQLWDRYALPHSQREAADITTAGVMTAGPPVTVPLELDYVGGGGGGGGAGGGDGGGRHPTTKYRDDWDDDESEEVLPQKKRGRPRSVYRDEASDDSDFDDDSDAPKRKKSKKKKVNMNTSTSTTTATKGKKSSVAYPEIDAHGVPVAALVELLTRVIKLKAATWFREPVTQDIAPDYAEVIARPMDLGTVLQQVKEGRYTGGCGAILADLRQIWDNCAIYNGEDAEITVEARKLGIKIEQMWRNAGLPGLL